jgi:organic hydroperoxide reductase OsmC/OhrA
VFFISIFEAETEIEIELLEQENWKIKFKSESMKDLVINNSAVLPEKRGTEARKLLAASLAECVCANLLFLLNWAKVDLADFKSTAKVSTTRDSKGRIYVDKVNLIVNLDITEDKDTLKKIERVKNLFRKGCLITRSLERGIKVNYSIET